MKNHHLAIFILLVAVIGCKIPGFSSGGGLSGSSKGTATGGSDPKADVIEASKKFIALQSFTANMEGVGQTAIKSQVKYAAPDRFHITYLGGTGAGMEIIYIGKDGYMKAGDKWSKMPSTGQSIPNLRDSFTEEGLKTLSDVKYDGGESLSGKSASVYSYKNVTPAGANPFTSKIWISNDTGVPMKIHVEYPNNQALKYMDVSYDTDAKVTIEPPIK
ncbi:MAG: hypothetical protein PSX80_09000 [bacterium]|nr:hypothetical protein [bacterium]